MANSLGPTGLTIDSLNDLVAALTASLQAIYGTDINVNSNSPDGQMINIFCQAQEDLLELLQSTYNSFAYATAYGTQLDQRLAILGISRKQGTYTTTPVTITVNQALTLYGLDQTAQTVFTVADQSGNQYNLVTTNVFGSAGSASLTFQAINIGEVQVTANTITNQVTNILGVTVVNNPSTSGTVTGVNEETDTQYKVRAGQSFALASTGPADSIESALLATNGITDALVEENDTGMTDDNGTVAHTIWAIVNGGAAADIGQAIYAKKAPGCGMRGNQSYTITRPNGTTFTALWDTAVAQPLYIKFGILWRGAVLLDNATIKTQLAAALSYTLNLQATIGDIVTAMATIAPTAIVLFGSNQGVSADNSTFGSVANTTSPKYYFTVSTTNITIS